MTAQEADQRALAVADADLRGCEDVEHRGKSGERKMLNTVKKMILAIN